MSKCGKGCMPECEYFTTGGCISPFNCMYKEESGYINTAASGTAIYTGGEKMKDYFVRISYNSDTDIWEEIDEELNLELNEISKAPLALCKKAKFLETENLRYKTQIESGKFCDREEVRKETAKEILRMIKDKGLLRYGGYLLHDSDFDTISKLYGVGD